MEERASARRSLTDFCCFLITRLFAELENFPALIKQQQRKTANSKLPTRPIAFIYLVYFACCSATTSRVHELMNESQLIRSCSDCYCRHSFAECVTQIANVIKQRADLRFVRDEALGFSIMPTTKHFAQYLLN